MSLQHATQSSFRAANFREELPVQQHPYSIKHVHHVQVPFETLKRDARDRKALITGLQQAASKVAKLTSSGTTSKEQAQSTLSKIEADLKHHIAEV